MILDGTKQESIEQAASRLLSGDVVAFATETVYGLGAQASNEAALEKIFALKDRPKTDPLILHIADFEALNECVLEVPEVARKLMAAFWPGPLTLIFQRSPNISDLITAGRQTVAVRWPSHPVAQALIRQLGSPIAAPSANKFQHISTTCARDVEKELGTDLLILDGGPCEKGLESTIVSVDGELRVLRLGAVSLESLAEAVGEPIRVEKKAHLENVSAPAPGQFELHYAPQSKLRLMNSIEEFEKLSLPEKLYGFVLVFSNRERDILIKKGFQRIRVLSPQGQLSEAAQNLYSEVRWLDEQKPKQIYALKVPDRAEGKAINDRLTRAQRK